MSEYLKPLPEPSIDSQPFWDGLKQGRLLLQTCSDCGTIRHYPRPMCAECYSMACHWTEASGRGTLYSWTETHHPFHFAFKSEVPYVLATVDLAEGVRIQTQLLGAKGATLRLGQPVAVVLERAVDDWVLPYVRLTGGG